MFDANSIDAQHQVGGADRDRTGGLLVANQALSQLSYSPIKALSFQPSAINKPILLRAESEWLTADPGGPG
jgi:hypothetical protein